MPGPDPQQRLPQFLHDAGAFQLHLDEQFEGRDKGDGFVGFAAKVLPLCEFWGDMPPPTPNPKRSHDRGVDLLAEHPTRSGRIVVQSKYRMREVADLDGVMSKWSAYDRDLASPREEQSQLFPEARDVDTRYVLITASNLGEILRRYGDSRLPSLEFFRTLQREHRLEILDGPRLLATLQVLYRQSYVIAPQLDLELGAEPIHLDGVFLSVIPGRALRDLYERYGSSLFFDNIREFLGIAGNERRDARGSVNEAISETLRDAPRKMLGRNNGITFRADAVSQIGPRKLQLQGGSIVNGCQTTMCIVQTGSAADDALVAVKVVVGEESWEVAKSANYQNQVSRIELELARFLRPKVVRQIATDLGYSMESTAERSISNVLEDIHHTKISYDAIKLLYIGLFSWYPGNLFEGHYSQVRLDVLALASALNRQEYVMRVLFRLLVQMQAASEEFKLRFREERLLELFRRFFREEEPRYNCLLGLLTACGCVDDDLIGHESAAESDTATAWTRIERFLGRLELVLTRHGDVFNRVFRHAVVALASPVLNASRDQQDLLQRMSKEIEGSAGRRRFPSLFLNLRLHIKTDDYLAERPIDFGEPAPAPAPEPARGAPRRPRAR